MANQTTNIGLRKPVPTENFDIDRDFNANWDIIDEELGSLKAGVANTYTKTETDTALAQKADKADTYTKAEVDGKDALKADLSEIETARGTEPTLGARLDADKAEVSAELAEKANKEQEAWITPTLLYGWTGNLQYYKDDLGLVHVRGNIRGGTNFTPVYNLPTGYRPIGTTNQIIGGRIGESIGGDYIIARQIWIQGGPHSRVFIPSGIPWTHDESVLYLNFTYRAEA